jgi:hypothetical protein
MMMRIIMKVIVILVVIVIIIITFFKSVVFKVVTLSNLYLWTDTDISEEHYAPIFKDKVCRFRSRLCYIDKLQGRWSWDPRRRGNGRSLVRANGKKWTEHSLYEGHIGLSSQVGNAIMRKNGPF